MANTTSNEALPPELNIFTVSGADSELPKKIDTNEITIAARIKNCAFNAADVLIKANAVRSIKAVVPVNRRSFIVVPNPK